ncbi:PREDICTED: MORN repeat-containing protein 1-like [Acropora digitifera]|uniref:MORN repeat-containing protein 1-like n=1 Tax=Acropora digitifera TaxID=70779 RepID=UPI00077A1CB1|nr:PREDICTED: MORN repeat-containing protein 1-like [Acropora digitifera]
MATILNNTRSKGAGNYIGETKKQLRDGFGVYNYPNKFFRYEGEWSKGKKHGHGKLVMADGSFYEGQFVDGEIQGHGFRRWASSRNEYTGQFVKGELNGHGIMVYGDGSHYEGEWQDNKREGEGKLLSKDGSVYEGSFHNHKQHGEGKLIHRDGHVYEGDWVNDLRQGHGIMKFIDGTIYGGQWWGDMFNGEGSMIHTSGVSYEGMWINGRPEAEGRQICIVGEEYVEVTQGRPFGFEVECVTIDGEPTQEEGRSLQVTAGIKVGALKRSADSSEAEVDTMMTPFGFEIEPYPLTEMLGEAASETALQCHPQQVASVMSSIPYQASPPVGDELAKNVDNLQITDGSDTLGDKESFTADHVQPSEILNRTAPPSQGSAGFPNGHDKNATADGLFVSPTTPPGVRIWNSFAAIQESLHELAKNAETRGLTSKFKSKVTVAVASNTLKGANRAATEAGKKKKDSGSADMMEKMDGKRKKEKKEEKDDKFCRPGDYVVIVEDVTSPPFLDVTLAPAFLHVKVTPKKRAKSKMESRKT